MDPEYSEMTTPNSFVFSAWDTDELPQTQTFFMVKTFFTVPIGSVEGRDSPGSFFSTLTPTEKLQREETRSVPLGGDGHL